MGFGLGGLLGGAEEAKTKVKPWGPQADAAKWAFGTGKDLYGRSQDMLGRHGVQNDRYFKALETMNSAASWMDKWQNPILNRAKEVATGKGLYNYSPDAYTGNQQYGGGEQYMGGQRYKEGEYKGSPYLDDVVQGATRDMRNSLVRDAMPSANSQAIAAGAYGGDANALMKAALAGEYGKSVGDVSANIRNTDYQNWRQQDFQGFENQQARQMQGQEAFQNRAMAGFENFQNRGMSAWDQNQARELALRGMTGGEMMQAQGMLPMLANQQMQHSQIRANVADARRGVPLANMNAMWQPFMNYTQAASPWQQAGAGTTTSSQGGGPGGFLKGAMGTALMGGMTAGSFGFGPMAGMMMGRPN